MQPSRTALKWLTFMVSLFVAFFILGSGVAQAAADGPGVSEITSGESLLELSPLMVTAIIGTFIPLLTGIITKSTASDAIKGVVSAFLSAGAGLIVTGFTENGGSIISETSAILAGLAFLTAMGTYFGVWGPNGITSGLAEKVNRSTPGIVGPRA